jgi:sensor histidine kinase YesM
MFADMIHTVMIIIPFLVVPAAALRALRKGNNDAIYLLLGATAFTANVIWGVIKNTGWMEMGYYPIDMVDGFVVFSLFWFKRYFRSAAQTAKLAEQLQETDKQKDDFLVNTSHELRNPLHGILTIAQTVMERDPVADAEKNREQLRLLISIGKRMSYLLNDLLDITRLKESTVQLHMAELRIQSIGSGVMDMIGVTIEGKPVRLCNRIPQTFPVVMADENRIIQILFNLLHNAAKFTEQGTITVEAERKGNLAYISVTDTGIGIDEDTQQIIFESYEQGNTNNMARASGLGLGLSITKQLVELHQGTIKVRSVPGEGSSFTFTLPLSNGSIDYAASVQQASVPIVYQETAAAMSMNVVEPSTTLAPDRPDILAVDDDPMNLNILESVLSAEHYDIVITTSAQDALGMLDTREWDLIIADVMMPHMSGYELSRAIRERYSMTELPILLLTARSRMEDVEAGFLSGANDYVTKPVDAAELRSRVRSLTGIKKSVRERLRMEAAWLQSQIQPHFLFNTLNAVIALSDIDLERMRNLLHAFADYLRTSFDFQNAEQMISLDHELDLVRAYLWIEQERFGDRLEVIWEVDEELQLEIPPLSIQPIVENAVRHGISKQPDGGKLWIRIRNEGQYVEISVTDNGTGMDRNTLEHLLDKHQERRSGIGLLNTNQRLKQLYGRGLHIHSAIGHGTTVTFWVK